MQPATIRRLLVFGVCVVAVSCLYLVPSVSSTSSRIGATSGPRDARTAPPGTAAGEVSGSGQSLPSANSTTSSGLPEPLATPRAGTTPGTSGPGGSVDSATSTSSSTATAQQPVRNRAWATRGQPAATAVDPGNDQAAPTAISRLWRTGTDPDQLGLAWAAADDDRGSVWYEVSVNGFTVTTTRQTEASVGWFNDASTHVVQVRAVDLAGNRGPWSPTLLVTRPNPASEPGPESTTRSASNSAADAGTTSDATPTSSSTPKEDNS